MSVGIDKKHGAKVEEMQGNNNYQPIAVYLPSICFQSKANIEEAAHHTS